MIPDLFADIFGASPEWMTNPDRPCAHGDPERYFPSEGTANPRNARALCAGCPVQTKCLAYAIDHPELEGIWGGTLDAERKKLRDGAAA